MASRRNLKKGVNYISNLLIGMCIYEGAMADEAKRESLKPILLKAVNLQKDIVSRISHTEPGNTKGFYKKLREDFNKGVTELFQELESVNG